MKNGGVNSVRGTGQRSRSSAYAGKGSASVASENGSYRPVPLSALPPAARALDSHSLSLAPEWLGRGRYPEPVAEEPGG